MMIGSFFALMFYILAPVDLGLKKIFYTPMIATACVMTVLFVFSFILAVSGCETHLPAASGWLPQYPPADQW